MDKTPDKPINPQSKTEAKADAYTSEKSESSGDSRFDAGVSASLLKLLKKLYLSKSIISLLALFFLISTVTLWFTLIQQQSLSKRVIHDFAKVEALRNEIQESIYRADSETPSKVSLQSEDGDIQWLQPFENEDTIFFLISLDEKYRFLSKNGVQSVEASVNANELQLTTYSYYTTGHLIINFSSKTLRAQPDYAEIMLNIETEAGTLIYKLLW